MCYGKLIAANQLDDLIHSYISQSHFISCAQVSATGTYNEPVDTFTNKLTQILYPGHGAANTLHYGDRWCRCSPSAIGSDHFHF